MMSHSRYTQVRERILELYQIIAFRAYPVWIAPRSMMSLDDLRNRHEYTQDGFANDSDFYNTQQLRSMKIPQIVDLLEHITSPNELGFNNANKVVVEIYESIQEYIRLWCEIMMSNLGFSSPPRKELRALESLAYLIFPTYKAVKHFTVNQRKREQFRNDSALEKRGLAGFAVLFAMNSLGVKDNPDEYSFVSYLDNMDSTITEYTMVSSPSTGPSFLGGVSLADSIAKISNDDSENTWVFKG